MTKFIYIVNGIEYEISDKKNKHKHTYFAFSDKATAEKRMGDELKRMGDLWCYVNGAYVKHEATGEITEYYIEKIVLK